MSSTGGSTASGVSGVHRGRIKKPTPKEQREKRESQRAKRKQRVGEERVDDLPDELTCTYMLQDDKGEIGISCPEEATVWCDWCHAGLCIAHVFSTVTTMIAKPVVQFTRGGDNRPEIAHESKYCRACSYNSEGVLVGTVNPSFNACGDFTPP